jgi:hypothetical protein
LKIHHLATLRQEEVGLRRHQGDHRAIFRLHMGDHLILAVFKNRKCPVLLFFHGNSDVSILTKNRLGYIFGDCFKNSSGHPGRPRLTQHCDDSQVFRHDDVDGGGDDGRREIADDDEEGDASAHHEANHAHLDRHLAGTAESFKGCEKYWLLCPALVTGLGEFSHIGRFFP